MKLAKLNVKVRCDFKMSSITSRLFFFSDIFPSQKNQSLFSFRISFDLSFSISLNSLNLASFKEGFVIM